MSASPLEMVLAALEAAGSKCRRSGAGYQAQCPAHDDQNPSLSIDAAEGGAVLLKCHAGCTAEAIVVALGLTMRDLFPGADVDTTPRKSKKPAVSSTASHKLKEFPTAAAAVATLTRKLGKRSGLWTYQDTSGNPVALVVRWDLPGGKTFRPVAKIGDSWRIGDPGGPWPLYQLPAILQSQSRVYVCEGEKATDAMRSLGLTATTSAHGANSPHRSDWAPLAGREVIILPDHDDAGEKYAKAVIDLLHKLTPAPKVKVVRLPALPEHGDAVDFIAMRKAVDHG